MDTKPSQDERILAALVHAAALLPFWGIILSGLIWATQREKSDYVRHQGVQALAWQAAAVAMMFVGMGCYLASFFLGFATMLFTGATDEPPFLFPLFPLFSMGLLFLLMAVFIVGGLIGTIQSLQGRKFVYPIIGTRVQEYLTRSVEE